MVEGQDGGGGRGGETRWRRWTWWSDKMAAVDVVEVGLIKRYLKIGRCTLLKSISYVLFERQGHKCRKIYKLMVLILQW